MGTGRAEFWKNSYDSGINDLDPALWESTLNDGFKKSFSTFQKKKAVAFMGVEITFAELDTYSNRFANMLLAEGLTKGDVVGIDLANIPEYLIAYIGTLKAGCVVSGVSPLLSADEIKFQLADSEAKAFVTLDAIFEKHLTKIHAHLPKLKVVIAASIGGFLPGIKSFLGKLLGKIPTGKITQLEGKTVLMFHDVLFKGSYPDTAPDVTLVPDDIAYLQYTGGTTGAPKGAMLTHRNALADIRIVVNWLHLENGGSVALSAFPLFHIAGLFTSSCFLYYGITQILIPNPRNTDHICEEMKKYKPFVTANVPSLYHLLMSNPKFSKLDHSALEICISAAASFPEDSQKKLETIIGHGKLIEAYGMTETSPLTVMNPTWGEKKLGYIGLPLPNTVIKLLDPSTGREVPCGEPGEMCVKGPVVMAGYYKQPEETARAVDSDGFMHTGDIAVQDKAGYLKIVDRTKDMVNVSGYKVFSIKVEAILAEHPAVGEIAIIGIPDIERPGSELVAAFVKVRDGYQYDGDEISLKKNIVSFARERLATYEIPKIIEFRNEMPLTSVGKLNKKKLREDFSC
jgi:long-chain acyl-CoA synthetase